MLLAPHFFLQKAFKEHHFFNEGGETIPDSIYFNLPEPIFFKHKKDCICVSIDSTRRITTNYFIGIDWLFDNTAICIEPKLNNSEIQTDYLKMLFSSLKHFEVAEHTADLFEIKWDAKHIEIEQQQDLLTPLLVVQFLRMVQHIVKTGLKKTYYKVENNLFGKVKGKIQVSQTIKRNSLKNRPLNTHCCYDEFGYNGLENRLLKKALLFIQRYLPTLKGLQAEIYTANIFNYLNPAFEVISDEVNMHEVKHSKNNMFYKGYEDAVRLAKIILQRFGYNISYIGNNKLTTPPFWIDMSKLFELYVLGQLKEIYGNEILYGSREAKGKYGLPDFLLTKKNEKTIIDAKYKPIYKDDKYDIDNIRQLSGYGRDIGILKKLGFITNDEQNNTVVKCLLIYPDQNVEESLHLNKEESIDGFIKFYKKALKLPIIKNKQ